jgi:hypothetical protein
LLLPCIFQLTSLSLSYSSFISAPKALQTERQERVSRESSGFFISETPSARAAISNCLMVWDLEAGIFIVPVKRWGVKRTVIIL